MRWLSDSVEVLVAQELRQGGNPKVHDAVVVGSGYGGAVAALRLAEHGVRVLVLERGKEYVSGDFPNDVGQAFGHVRVERDGSRNVNGYESGLYDLRMGENIGALVGNALGGTSQINANVVLAPDRRVFDKQGEGGSAPAWPAELRPHQGRFARSLLKGYAAARRELEPERFSSTVAFQSNVDAPGGAQGMLVKPLKTQRLAELGKIIAQAGAQDVAVSVKPVWLTADLNQPSHRRASMQPLTSGCVGCGDCVSGCNENAKKTLTYTYLPRAYERGARMFTGVSVLSVRRAGEAWVLRFVRTEGRKSMREGGDCPVHELHAKHVVLSAGTFGSTEILLRSSAEHGLALSGQLGKRLSTNGDSLSFGYMGKARVNGIGVGSSQITGSGFAVGPTITSMVRIDHKSDVSKSMLIQDGAVPYAISRLFEEMVATTGALSQLDEWTFRDTPRAGTTRDDATDWAVLQGKGRSHTQTLLGIGHDHSAGHMQLRDGRLRIRYDKGAIEQVEALHEGYLAMVERQGAIYLRNPALHPLPRKVSGVLSGPAMGGGAFTVHPLGGCCMAQDAAQGVVDHLGRVFDPGPGSAAVGRAALHLGLYVLDGSIVPTSLGANPLFTIAALAERAMHALAPVIAASAQSEPATLRALGQQPAHSGQDYNPHAREVDVHFTEAMRAGKEDFLWQGRPMAAHLLLHLPVNDLELFATDGHHRITIPNQTGSLSGDKEGLNARLRIDPDPYDESTCLSLTVESGWVSILPVPETGRLLAVSRWLRTLITWFIVRGRDEIARYVLERLHLAPRDPTDEGPSSGFWAKVWSLLKLCGHASESRIMEYKLQLRETQPRGDAVRGYTLRGLKKVGYPASWRAIGAYITSRGHKPLARPNVWKAFGALEVVIRDEDGAVAGEGLLSLDMLDMTRMHAPQLALARDTPNALMGLAAYPFWFARLLAKTRLWDFRAPDYPALMPKELTGRSDIPVPAATVEDPPSWWPVFTPLRISTGIGGAMKSIDAQTIDFIAPRLSADEPAEKNLKLRLTRYQQDQLARRDGPSGLTRCKAILLIGGLGQSNLSFLAPELDRKPGQDDDEPALAEFFYEQGFDVWLLDYRLSPHLDASKLPCTMDQVAAFDIPAAVNVILQSVSKETGCAFEKSQLFAYGHCVGAASLAMSLLGGFLKHKSGEDKLAGVAFSQMQAITIGSRSLQMRMRMSGLARDLLGIDYLRLSPVERLPTAMEASLDRLFASLPVEPGQECPHERSRWWPRTPICTCKRLSGIISPVINHARIKPKTHEKLAVYFGRANTSVLAHGAQCVENERLVNAEGQNVYLTEGNIRQHLRLPVALIHGKASALFDVESAIQTYKRICRIHPDLRRSGAYARPILAEGFAHFDCVVGHGKDMQDQVLRPLREFFDMAWNWTDAGAQAQAPVAALARAVRPPYAKAPLAGPVQGWSRVEIRAGKPTRLVRLWIEVDEGGSDSADWVATDCRTSRGATRPDGVRLWPVTRLPLRARAGHPDVAVLASLALGADEPYIAIAVADLEFDLTQVWNEDLHVRMFSLHSSGPLQTPTAPPSPADANRHWRNLSRKLEFGRKLALRADPGTVSRKRRSLALPWTYGLPSASVHAQRLRIPDPTAGVAFVAASCRHPGLAFEDRRSEASLERVSRFLAADCMRPAFMLMLGDQIYADATAGLMDSPSAIEKIVLRHRQAFTSAAFAELTSSLPVYMVIDDHEIGDNWSLDALSEPGGAQLFETAHAAFAAYQWAHSPRNGATPGFNFHFEENGCSFFVLDTRTQRSRHPAGGGEPLICSAQQISALLGWLMCRDNDARPKFVVSGSVFAPGLRSWDSGVAGISERHAESWQLAQQQRMEVLSFIAERGIKNVVFVAGDYHCCATATIDLAKGLRAYAVVAPPLYAQLPAANTKPADILAHETIRLRGGRLARIDAAAHSSGDGFTDIRATPAPHGRWRLEVRHHILAANDKTPHPRIVARCFNLD